MGFAVKDSMIPAAPGEISSHPSGFPFRVTMNTSTLDCPGCRHTNHVFDTTYIELLACTKCGSVIDVNSRSLVKKQHKSGRVQAIGIGNRASLRGQQLFVIGHIGYKDHENSTWDDYVLIDDEGQYSTLTHEEGHFILYRDIKQPPFGAARLLDVDHKKEQLVIDGKRWLAAASSYEKVDFIRGQVNSMAVPGSKQLSGEAFRPPDTISVSRVKNVPEYSLGEWLHPDEVAEAFGVTLPMPDWGHAAQPVWRSVTHRLATMLLTLAGILSLAVGLFQWSNERPRSIFKGQFQRSDFEDGVLTKEFKVLPADVPLIGKVISRAPGLTNSWVYLEIRIVDSKGFGIMSFRQELSFYQGYEGGEHWTEGSRGESSYFRMTKPGTYKLVVAGEVDKRAPYTRPILVDVRAGYVLVRYLLAFGLLALIYPIWIFFRRRKIQAQGWDEVDDDDY